MGRVVVAMYVSIDGVVEDPGGGEGFDHGGWSAAYWNDELEKLQQDLLFASNALLLGRVTYEAFAKAWPDPEHEQGEFADRMNAMPKHVATRTLTSLEWNAKPLTGEVAGAVAELKQNLDLLVYGSATLVDVLTEHGLVDEYRLMIHPIVVGAGRRMFEAASAPLRLVDSTTTSAGVAVLTYVPAS